MPNKYTARGRLDGGAAALRNRFAAVTSRALPSGPTENTMVVR